jgi:hypothetical protein
LAITSSGAGKALEARVDDEVGTVDAEGELVPEDRIAAGDEEVAASAASNRR